MYEVYLFLAITMEKIQACCKMDIKYIGPTDGYNASSQCVWKIVELKHINIINTI